MELRPFNELIGMSKEKLDKAMAPIRAKQVKSKAQLEMSKLEAEILTLETKVQEGFTGVDVDFPKLMDELDKIALLQRRMEQYEVVLKQLFPKD